MFAIICFIVFITYLWLQNHYKYFGKLKIPYIKPIFLLGSASNVGRTEHTCDFFRREYENFKNKGPAFGAFFLAHPMIIVTDPTLIKEILVKNFDNFHDHGFDFDFNINPLAKNLFFMNGQEWRNLRVKLTPTFTSGRIKMMFSTVALKADQMVNYMNNTAEECLIKEIFASFTMEVIANVAFGLDLKCHGDHENKLMKISNDFFHPSTLQKLKFYFMKSFPKISSKLKIKWISRETEEYFIKIIGENLEYRMKNKIHRNDFFQMLISLDGVTVKEIAAYSFGFLTAGFETSSSVMTFCTYELALNQDIQDRLRNEIEEVVGRHNGEVTYDAIMEMKYLDMVFNETVRKYPIIDAQYRRSINESKIPNTDLVIPASASIIIPTVGLQNDERFFENPHDFNPERFNDDNVKKLIPFTYIPFSEGLRNCIGLRFGTMQAKIGLVKLLRNFKILPCSKTLIPMKYAPSSHLQSPLDGLWVKIEKIVI